jgi:hypothetical protein
MVLSPTAMQKRFDAHERALSWRIETPGISGVATVRHPEPLNTSLNIRVSVCARPVARHQSVVGQDTPYRDAEGSGAGTDMPFHTPPARRSEIAPPSALPTATQAPGAGQETPNSSGDALKVGVGVIRHAPPCSFNARALRLGDPSLPPTATHV